MAGHAPEALRARVHRLACVIILRDPWVVSGAVDLACDLIVAGLETPATVEVAALPRGATFRDSADVVLSMLAEHGVRIPPHETDDDGYAALRTAFAWWNLPMSRFEGAFYARLPEWDQQDTLDRTLVIMMDERDNETDPGRRKAIEDRMRRAIRHAGPGPSAAADGRASP
jgi:hypothetical protein